MSRTNEVKFSLKVMMNKEKTKVFFAEVDGDFADVLLSFLTLPLGTIVRLLQRHYGDEAPVFGSLTTLYKGLADLDNVHFWTEGGKLMLLNPRSSFQAEFSKLKLQIDDTEPTRYFICDDPNCGYSIFANISMYYDTARCRNCGKIMNREIVCKTDSNTQAAGGGDDVFMIKTGSFLFSDDLTVLLPNDAGSLIQTLSKFGIKDIDWAEQRTLTVGFNEIMDLLWGSLFSETPLTDLILHKRQENLATAKFETASLLHQNYQKKETSRTEKKMILTITVQKSTNRFLFAQAEEDFVDFLFSFLTIPLAGVESLLGSNSGLKNIDNLHRSSANLNKYLKTTNNNLFNPELPPMYLSKNQIFSLNEQKTPELYLENQEVREPCLSTHRRVICRNKPVNFTDPKGQGSYVKGFGLYVVTDELTVTPPYVSSNLSVISGMKIQLFNVEEVEVEIGMEEALSILKASLTSNCALTNGLGSILNKRPKKGN